MMRATSNADEPPSNSRAARWSRKGTINYQTANYQTANYQTANYQTANYQTSNYRTAIDVISFRFDYSGV